MIDLPDSEEWRGNFLAWRLSAGVTQAQLAEELGITSRAYQDLEAGKSSLKRSHMLALEFIRLRYALASKRMDLLSKLGRETTIGLAVSLTVQSMKDASAVKLRSILANANDELVLRVALDELVRRKDAPDTTDPT